MSRVSRYVMCRDTFGNFCVIIIVDKGGPVSVGWLWEFCYIAFMSGNSASIHERLQPVTSYLSVNGVDD